MDIKSNDYMLNDFLRTLLLESLTSHKSNLKSCRCKKLFGRVLPSAVVGDWEETGNRGRGVVCVRIDFTVQTCRTIALMQMHKHKEFAPLVTMFGDRRHNL